MVMSMLASCATPKPAAPPPAATASLSAPAPIHPRPPPNFAVLSTPEDAEVLVDGVSYGPASSLGGPVHLKPGLHRVELRRAGYKTYRAEIVIGEELERIEVRLEKVE